MTISYDPAIFERSRSSFILSQTFKNNCHKFYGTFKLAIQMLPMHFLLGSLPSPLAFILLLIYLTVLAVLFFLIAKSSFGERKSSKYEDLGFSDAIKYRQKVIQRYWSKILILLLIISLSFNVLMGILTSLDIVK